MNTMTRFSVANFIEKFLMGTPDPRTGETRGGLPAVADWLWPFEDTWVSRAIDSTTGKILTAPPRLAARTVMAGLTGIEYAESYLLARPASTLLQASATSKYNINPLYRDGIQWQDFVDMWNASEYISPARALLQQQVMQQAPVELGPGAPGEQSDLYRAITNPYPTAGGVDPEVYEEAWDNSPFATVTSGVGDLAFLIVAGGKGVNVAASGVKRAAGLNTKVHELSEITKMREGIANHQRFRATDGKEGRFNIDGQHIENLAKETDNARIRSNPLLTQWTGPSSFNADALTKLIAKTDSEEMITQLVLADRGDPLALGRLFNSAPDHVWSLTDMNEKLAREFATGGQFIPSKAQSRVIQATFDSAIERDEFFTVVRDMFVTGRLDDLAAVVDDVAPKISGIPVASARGERLVALNDELEVAVRAGDNAEVVRIRREIDEVKKAPPARDEFDVASISEPGKFTTLTGTGSDFVPIGSRGGIAPIANAAGLAQNWLRRTVADARINRPNSYTEIPLGGRTGQPLTTLLFWAGNRQPLNMVSYNRLRPDEVVEEMTAYSRSSRSLREKTWTVTSPDPVTGLSRTETMASWEWRTRAIARLTEAKTRGDSALDTVVGDLQEELISVIANKYGVPQDQVALISRGLREQVEGAQAQVARDGYFMDGAERVVLDPITQRQLADSRILMPLDNLDWALRGETTTRFGKRGRGTRRVMRGSADVMDFIFKFFRTNVLFRGGYVPKNSFGEPGIAAFLADGSLVPRDGLFNAMKRFDANNDRRILQFKYAVADRLPLLPASRDQAEARRLFLSYKEKSNRLDELEAHIADLDSAATSPAMRAAYLDLAREERKIVYRQVKDLENELNLVDSAWTQVDEIPTFSELLNRTENIRTAFTDADFVPTATRRINELSGKAGLSAVEQAELKQLSALVAARRKVDAGELDASSVLDDISAKLEVIREQTFSLDPQATKQMQALRADLAKLDAERASLSGRIAARQLSRERLAKRDLSGEVDYELTVGGVKYTIPGSFSTTNNYGTALRADTAADLTAAQTMTGGRLNGAGAGIRWRQSAQGEVIQPFDPRYWDELTYVINRHILGDDFANMILTGKSDMEIMKWFQSPQGKKYMKQMGWNYDMLRGGPRGSVPATPLAGARGTDARITVFEEGIIAENRRLLNQYFPDPEFRASLAKNREWTPGEVQSALGGLDDLSPIYGTGLEFIGNRAARVNAAANNALNSIWRLLASRPESRFGRWPFYTRENQRQMVREIRIAQDRGQIVDGPALTAMKRSADARTIKEMENTFYNIRRMSNPVFAQRYLTAFAAAGWNATYRYFRLAYRNPGRGNIMAQTWFNILEGMGTDADGNVSKDWKDTKYITFSFPDEWNVPIQQDLRISADAINLGTQEFGYLPTIQIPVSYFLRQKPDLEVTIREKYPDVWDAMFEFGTETDPSFTVAGIPLDPLMSSYQKKAVTVARNVPEIAGVKNPFFQEISDDDWIRVASQDFDYQWYQWAKDGQKGPTPTIQESLDNARDFYIASTVMSWASPGAIRMSPEGQLYRDEWYKIRSAHPGDLPSAIAQMRAMYGPEAFFFLRSTSVNRAGMPATQDAYAIWRDNQGAVKDLRDISKDEPSLGLSLMFLDGVTYDESEFSQVVYDWQKNTMIPGETVPIRSRPTLQDRDDQYKLDRSWSLWNASTAKRDALMLQYDFKRLSPDDESAWLYEEWKSFENDFEQDPENALWFAEKNSSSAKAPLALKSIDYLLNDRSFMSGVRDSSTWIGIRDYRSELDNARKFYQEAEGTEERKFVAEQWDDFVRTQILPQAGNFANYYERFLAGRDLDLRGRLLLERTFDPNRGFPLPPGVMPEGTP